MCKKKAAARPLFFMMTCSVKVGSYQEIYFLKIKYTAKTRKNKPTKWFHLSGSDLNTRIEIIAKTVRDITS